jgi:hypothetical protein
MRRARFITSRIVGCQRPAEEFVLAIAEPFLDHLIPADRVVPDPRDKRRLLANEILAEDLRINFSRVVTAH